MKKLAITLALVLASCVERTTATLIDKHIGEHEYKSRSGKYHSSHHDLKYWAVWKYSDGHIETQDCSDDFYYKAKIGLKYDNVLCQCTTTH